MPIFCHPKPRVSPALRVFSAAWHQEEGLINALFYFFNGKFNFLNIFLEYEYAQAHTSMTICIITKVNT